jgi:hypothetical protein
VGLRATGAGSADYSDWLSSDKQPGVGYRRNTGAGNYTAIGAGKNNGTGIGYVQFYSLPYSGPVLKLTP